MTAFNFFVVYFSLGAVCAVLFLMAAYRKDRALSCHDFIFAFLIFQVWAHALLLHTMLHRIFKKDFIVIARKKRI